MEQHHGTLTAESEGLGKGSRFIVRLPAFHRSEGTPIPDGIKFGKSIAEIIKRVHSAEDRYKQNTDSASESHSRSMLSCNVKLSSINEAAENTKLVLVVDDAMSNRKMLCRLLTNNGYTCEQACDGAECLRMVTGLPPSSCKYDLILMDFEMPIMNGPKATQNLRQLGYNIPIVGVTGNVLASDTDDFVAHGANMVLIKPLSITKLQECMIELKIFAN